MIILAFSYNMANNFAKHGPGQWQACALLFENSKELTIGLWRIISFINESFLNGADEFSQVLMRLFFVFHQKQFTFDFSIHVEIGSTVVPIPLYKMAFTAILTILQSQIVHNYKLDRSQNKETFIVLTNFISLCEYPSITCCQYTVQMSSLNLSQNSFKLCTKYGKTEILS